MKKKKLLALAIASAMAISPATVFADVTTSPATGSAVGDGKVEGYIDKEVFTVVVPTVAAGDFDFILDPQDLIKDSTNAAYTGATFTGTTGLYFKSDTNKYTADSKEMTITNKSSVDVNVNLEVKVTSDAGVTFTTDKTFKDDTTPSVFLGLINSQDADSATTPAAVDPSTLTASADVTMAAVDASKFEVKYSGGTYSYGLNSSAADADFKKMTFKLTGAANKNADWTDLKTAAPKIEVVWNISKADSATEGICLLVGSTFWVGPDKNDNTIAFAPNATVSDVKVNGAACNHTMTDNYIVVSWNDIVVAGQDSATTWTVTATVDGVNYTATYSLN